MFDLHREIEENVFSPFRQPTTTGNSRRNPKYLHYWNYLRPNWNSNGKSGELECRKVIATWDYRTIGYHSNSWASCLMMQKPSWWRFTPKRSMCFHHQVVSQTAALRR